MDGWTLQELEHREKQFDGRLQLDIFTHEDDSQPALTDVLTYVATSKNKNWLGPASIEAIAQQIAISIGPSGHNYQYLYQLADALHKVCYSLTAALAFE